MRSGKDVAPRSRSGRIQRPLCDSLNRRNLSPLETILARELPSYRGNLNFPASLAAQTARPRVLDELFHSVGWSLTLQDMKAMLDRAAARGANLFVFHAFCYSIGGLRKWDAPPSEFDQNPYWPHFPLLSAYAGRLAYALSLGRRVAPVAVLDPITSIWAQGRWKKITI